MNNIKTLFVEIPATLSRQWDYFKNGVWNDIRDTWRVNLTKTLSLSVQSFMDKNLQHRAYALTYSTVLAIVPALAMIFAIGRGFGFQNILQSELFKYFPAQRTALETAFTYVDAYLEQSSQGLFVGIGVVFLLWTLVSLMGNIETTFNQIWGIKTDRTFFRKITDYTAIFLILPILMVCSAGLSLFMSSTFQSLEQFSIISPVLHHILDFLPLVISWFIFAGLFSMIPNTKVKFVNALLAGILCGTLFHLVQWLFLTGQIYVSKYNAIYGSFAFLPLMLVWLQLSWLITLIGVVITFAMQNISNYNFNKNIERISHRYLNEVTIITLAIIIKRFELHQDPITKDLLLSKYRFPVKLLNLILDRLHDSNLVSVVLIGQNETGFQPAYNINDMTVNDVRNRLDGYGETDFVHKVDKEFEQITNHLDNLYRLQLSQGDIKIKELYNEENIHTNETENNSVEGA